MRWTSFIILALLFGETAPAADISTGETPQAVVIADFDVDGRSDLAVANAFEDTVSIHLQTPDGNFPVSQKVSVGITPFSPSNFPRFLAVSDFNQDGKPDLTVLCSGDFSFGYPPSIQSLINVGDGTFAALPAVETEPGSGSDEFPVQFETGEFNGDGYSDLAVANLEGHKIRMMWGDGAGGFAPGASVSTDSTGEGPQDLAVLDLDGDGLDDILAVTATEFLAIRQTAAGVFSSPRSFTLPATGTLLRAVTLDDLDFDGKVDACLADATGRVFVLFGIDLSGTFSNSLVKTDPSLSGCSDIATLLWDDDLLPDILVANRLGDRVTVFYSAGTVQSYPTGTAPRRLAVGDLNRDGRLDLVTANESDSSGKDATTFLNPGFLTGGVYSAEFTSDHPLEGVYEVNLPHPTAVAVPEESGRIWVVESSRRALQETDMDGDKRRRVETTFDIGGIHFTGKDKGHLLERFAPKIHKFEIENGNHLEIKSTLIFSYMPDVLGFCGLAYDEERKDFYISLPGSGKILKVDKTDGSVAAEWDVTPPAWDLAWNEERNRLMAANPGRSDVRAYTTNGTLDSNRSFDLYEQSVLFRETGIAGLGWDEEPERYYILTSGGFLAKTDSTGTVLEINSLAPVSRINSMDYDDSRNELYLLGPDAHIKQIKFPGFGGEDLISLWPALEAQADFLPSALAFDPDTDTILVADRKRPRYARFSRSGSFTGFQDFTGTVSTGSGSITGFEFDSNTDSPLFRYDFSVNSANSLFDKALPRNPMVDIALKEDLFLAGNPNPGELVLVTYPDGGTRMGLTLLPSQGPRGLTFGPDEQMYVIYEDGSPSLKIFSLSIRSSVSNWGSYK